MSTIKSGLRRRRRAVGEVVYFRGYYSGQSEGSQVQIRQEIATLQIGLDIPGADPWDVLGHIGDAGVVIDYYWWVGYHQWRIGAPPKSELGVKPTFIISGADENLTTDVGGSQLRFWNNRTETYTLFNIRRSLSLPPGLNRLSENDWRYNIYPAPNTIVNNLIIWDIYRIHLPSVIPVQTVTTGVQEFEMRYIDTFWYDPDDVLCPALAPNFQWLSGAALFWETNDVGVPDYTPNTGVAR